MSPEKHIGKHNKVSYVPGLLGHSGKKFLFLFEDKTAWITLIRSYLPGAIFFFYFCQNCFFRKSPFNMGFNNLSCCFRKEKGSKIIASMIWFHNFVYFLKFIFLCSFCRCACLVLGPYWEASCPLSYQLKINHMIF